MRPILALVAALTLATPALAHHGWGSYDADKPVTITAPIEKVALQNPHGEMTLTMQGKAWLVTLAPLSRMMSRGAVAELLPVGKAIKAYGYPRRDGTPEIRAEWIEVDGKRFELR